jgi:hypothetical protein
MLYLKKNFKLFFILFLILLIFYRSPYIFLNGRFIAEEGSWWFSNVFENGPLSGLLYVYWGSSYFNFWANISSVLAYFFPLEVAPLITVYMALIVKFYMFLYIFYSQSKFLKNNFDKSIISLILLLAPMMTSTIWLNTLVSQVYFSIIIILIFFQKENSSAFIDKFSNLIIFIAGITSIIACFFTPFFLYKYFKNKNKYHFLRFISSFIPFIFQFIIFAYSSFANLTDENRFFLSIDKLVNFLYNVPIKSIFGTDLSKIIFYDFLNSNLIIAVSCAFIVLILLSTITYNELKNYKDEVLLYLVIFFILHSIFAIYSSKYDQVQGRYAVIPSVLFMLSIYRLFQISKNLKIIFFFMIVSSIGLGFFEYRINNKYPQLLSCLDNCPNWNEEVDKWRLNNDYDLKIWDYPRKTMTLKKR